MLKTFLESQTGVKSKSILQMQVNKFKQDLNALIFNLWHKKLKFIYYSLLKFVYLLLTRLN